MEIRPMQPSIFSYLCSPANIKKKNKEDMCVVYFDQHLGATHSKCWSKKSFSAFLPQKPLKKQEICSKFQQKTGIFKFAPERWSTVLFSKKRFFWHEMFRFRFKMIYLTWISFSLKWVLKRFMYFKVAYNQESFNLVWLQGCIRCVGGSVWVRKLQSIKK